MSLNERQRRVDNVSPLEQSVHQEVAHTYIFRASDKIIRFKKNLLKHKLCCKAFGLNKINNILKKRYKPPTQ